MKKAKAFRKLYAELVLANGKVSSRNARLMKAFSTIKREDFLGPGPWQIYTPSGYISTPTDHVELLYQDVLVALDQHSGINNGQPSLHAKSIDAMKLKKGESIAHIGAGTGYYSAILGFVTGESGRVHAFEINPDLIVAAEKNLSAYSNTVLHPESGDSDQFPEVDIIYVNAGVTHPADCWLDKLNINGRMVFPLTGDENAGIMILLQKYASDQFSADIICGAQFIPCSGLRDVETGFRLSTALTQGKLDKVRSLRRHTAPDNTNCFSTDGWWLSSASVG